ncbi:MAG: hypothetical protein ACXAB7_23200 [Candidatus Kariarchaeaceae archaeon]|jgi:hypothetical protein
MIFKPSKSFVENLQAGDLAINCFDRIVRIQEIVFRGKDVHGKAYVMVRGEFGDNGASITETYKEDECVRTLGLTREYDSERCQNLDKLITSHDSIWQAIPQNRRQCRHQIEMMVETATRPDKMNLRDKITFSSEW